jgi:hypothetical protein
VGGGGGAHTPGLTVIPPTPLIEKGLSHIHPGSDKTIIDSNKEICSKTPHYIHPKSSSSKYHQISAKYDQISAKYDQISAKKDHKITMNVKNKIQKNPCILNTKIVKKSLWGDDSILGEKTITYDQLEGEYECQMMGEEGSGAGGMIEVMDFNCR